MSGEHEDIFLCGTVQTQTLRLLCPLHLRRATHTESDFAAAWKIVSLNFYTVLYSVRFVSRHLKSSSENYAW